MAIIKEEVDLLEEGGADMILGDNDGWDDEGDEPTGSQITFAHRDSGKADVVLTDSSLAQMSIRELNEVLAGQPNSVANEVKVRRRLLKNRGYAQNTRSKRVKTKRELETAKSRSSQEIAKLKRANRAMKTQLDDMRRRKARLLQQVAEKKKRQGNM